MRSEMVYAAGIHIKNRFLLASTVMQAVRKLHVQATRTEETINKAFDTVSDPQEQPASPSEALPRSEPSMLAVASAA
jgi:hypothetical protein